MSRSRKSKSSRKAESKMQQAIQEPAKKHERYISKDETPAKAEVLFFNDLQGYGFAKTEGTNETVFFHMRYIRDFSALARLVFLHIPKGRSSSPKVGDPIVFGGLKTSDRKTPHVSWWGHLSAYEEARDAIDKKPSIEVIAESHDSKTGVRIYSGNDYVQSVRVINEAKDQRCYVRHEDGRTASASSWIAYVKSGVYIFSKRYEMEIPNVTGEIQDHSNTEA